LDGDQWIINGQKLWGMRPGTDWCFLLARTEPELSRHKGISALFVPMDSPGLTCRTIHMASWEHEVGEAFFDDVTVPADHILGARGDGWSIAMTTFAYERGPGDVGSSTKYQRMLARLEMLAEECGRAREHEVRRQLSLAYTLGEAMRLNVLESLSRRVAGRPPGSEGSVGKLLWSDAEQTISHIAMDLLGPQAVLGLKPDWLADFLDSRAASVYGGSSQIQKNILAQRVLGLPR
jgi:alkylation response protein AidB-like acyl-CoA dehydrogenase